MTTRSRAAWRHDYDRFCERLRDAREAAGLTQREAAKRLDRPQSWLAQRETGEVRVDIVELSHLARLYRKSLDFFAPFRIVR